MTKPFLLSRHARFAAAYALHGIAERAAVQAGYSPKTARAAASRLLTTIGVRSELGRLAAVTESDRVLSLREIRERWTSIGRGETGANVSAQLRAMELLGNSLGFFLPAKQQHIEILVRYEEEEPYSNYAAQPFERDFHRKQPT